MAHLARTEDCIESPGHYADRIGREYSESKSIAHKKEFGQYLTPLPVALFMAGFYQSDNQEVVRILDPGAGTGVLSCALLERLASKVNKVILTVYELDPELLPLLKQTMQYTKEWLYLIEVVTSHCPISPKRMIELKEMFSKKGAAIIFISVFTNIAEFRKYIKEIAWETEAGLQIFVTI